MAVKIHDFFRHYRRETLLLFLLGNSTSAALATGTTYVLWQLLPGRPLLAISLGGCTLVLLNVGMALLLFRIGAKPLAILTQAIAHVSKDPVVTPPPDLKANAYAKNGLKDMVQTIYELAVNAQSGGLQPTNSAQSDVFHHLVEEMPCGVFALNTKGGVIYANAAAPVSPKPNNQIGIDLIFEPNDTLEKWLSECLTNKVRDTRTWVRIANKLPGEENLRIFDVIAYYQKNEAAGLEAIVVAFDRTALYLPDQEDMDFIALAAHELRGPITVIRGYLDVLNEELKTTLSPDQQMLVDRLQVSSERLSGYVNNILNVSRYDRNQFKVHPHEESLLDILKSLVPYLALRAQTQKRKLTFHIPSNLPTIAADRSSISEVITNLIDNAIKYSHENGDVVISATVKDDVVEVTVQDNGIGIPASVVGNLFTRFYRSHRSRQSVGGTGLGLYICKAIIDSHGGSIWVRSKEGEGTTFGFTLPIYATVAQKLRSSDNSSNDIVQRSDGWIKNHAMYRR